MACWTCNFTTTPPPKHTHTHTYSGLGESTLERPFHSPLRNVRGNGSSSNTSPDNGDIPARAFKSLLSESGCISMQRYWSSLRYSFLRTLFLLAADYVSISRSTGILGIPLPVLLSNTAPWSLSTRRNGLRLPPLSGDVLYARRMCQPTQRAIN